MSTLPDPTAPTPPSGGVGAGAKEKEALGGTLEFPGTSGVEVELPKEVASVGVSARPTSVPVPQPVAQWVQPLGQNVPAEPAKGTITLPITDVEIAQGLRQDSTSSWRWLAEWCRRRLKQIGLLK